MTVITGTIKNAAGELSNGMLTVKANKIYGYDGALIDGNERDFDVVDGVFTTTDIAPGPVKLIADCGNWRKTFEKVLPDQESIDFWELVESTLIYEPPVVSTVVQAKEDAQQAVVDAQNILDQVEAGAVPDDVVSRAKLAPEVRTELDGYITQAEATAVGNATYAPLDSPAFTGTPTGITKAHVGLGNVTNTSDADKPVSTAQQNALNAKLSIATAATSYQAAYAVDPAFGTGLVDAKAHIQAKLDACKNAGGGIVFLPPGTFLLNGSTGLIIGSNTKLIGSGRTSVLKPVYSSPTNYVIRSDYSVLTTHIVLRDFAIDRSGANVQHGILFRNCDGILVDGLHCFGTPSTVGGFINIGGFSAAPTVPPASEQCRNVRVVNCHMKGTDNFGIQFGGVVNGAIANNIAEDCYREVVGIEPGLGLVSENISVTGNNFGTGTTLVSGSTPTGVIVVTESSGGTIRNVAVSGNTVYGEAAIASDQNPGIVVIGSQNVSVTGNTCRKLNGPGISVGHVTYQSSYVTVVGNTVKDCNQGGNTTPNACGIRSRNAIKCLFSGNFVSGAAHNVALEETGSSGSNNVVGNYFLDNVNQTGTFGGNTTWSGNKVAASGSVDVYTSMSFIDGRNIGIGGGTGSQIGTSGSKMGFFGATPVARSSVTGSRGGNAALADLLTKLAALGLIVDSTSA
ncbi:hypothetical protein ACH47B_13400 [Rhodococcus sp. NPDC019627]|uniref:hypothetical protein n=1 Tax=unclassified Rhodococcus (in: high G+C Gram-positive bacteria) TaxID=192944 RepID=UPI0033D2ED49